MIELKDIIPEYTQEMITVYWDVYREMVIVILAIILAFVFFAKFIKGGFFKSFMLLLTFLSLCVVVFFIVGKETRIEDSYTVHYYKKQLIKHNNPDKNRYITVFDDFLIDDKLTLHEKKILMELYPFYAKKNKEYVDAYAPKEKDEFLVTKTPKKEKDKILAKQKKEQAEAKAREKAERKAERAKLAKEQQAQNKPAPEQNDQQTELTEKETELTDERL